MADNGAARRGFAGGFVGLFGVLAALAVAAVALVTCSVARSNGQASAMREGRAEGREYLAHCAAGVLAAKGNFRGLAGAEYRIGEEPQPQAGTTPPGVACPARAAIGPVTVRIEVRCGDALDRSCVAVTGVETAAGEPLPPI